MLNLSVPFPNHLDFCKLLSMPLQTATKVSWQASIVTKISTPLADGHTVAENTGSLLTSEVKRHRARLVLGWGTAWEDLWVLSAFSFLPWAVKKEGSCCGGVRACGLCFLCGPLPEEGLFMGGISLCHIRILESGVGLHRRMTCALC